MRSGGGNAPPAQTVTVRLTRATMPDLHRHDNRTAGAPSRYAIEGKKIGTVCSQERGAVNKTPAIPAFSCHFGACFFLSFRLFSVIPAKAGIPRK